MDAAIYGLTTDVATAKDLANTDASTSFINQNTEDLVEIVIKDQKEVLKESGITIKNEVSKTHLSFGEKTSLKRAIGNLITNGVKAINACSFCRTKELIISSEETETESILFIQDTGNGMSEQTKNNAFSYHFSGNGSTGLGLPVSKMIVENHNGTLEITESIEFDSQHPTAAHGTTFKITLPKPSFEKIELKSFGIQTETLTFTEPTMNVESIINILDWKAVQIPENERSAFFCTFLDGSLQDTSEHDTSKQALITTIKEAYSDEKRGVQWIIELLKQLEIK